MLVHALLTVESHVDDDFMLGDDIFWANLVNVGALAR
jgi:hypothetical protein